MFKNKKGFTLIELLVVIAIIGILSSVVLASLNTARNRGQDAKIKSEMSGLRAAAELYYDGNTGPYYNNLFTGNNTCASANTTVGQYVSSIAAAASSEACFSTAGASGGYAIVAALPSGGFWCVNHDGDAKQVAGVGVIGAADVDCD